MVTALPRTAGAPGPFSRQAHDPDRGGHVRMSVPYPTLRRMHLHRRGVAYAAVQLRRLAFSYRRVGRERSDVDLVLDGGFTIAVRVAERTETDKFVTVGGKRYGYVYPSWVWNFHVRGRPVQADVVVCVLCDGGRIRGAYVIPCRYVTGKTLKITTGLDYCGRYARWLDDWNAISWEACRVRGEG